MVLAVVVAACGSDSSAGPDGRVDAHAFIPAVDAGLRDGGTPLLWVDFAASGCDSFDPSR